MIRPGRTNKSFFFQAEDGIRDLTVTGVQTCALPIWNTSVARWLLNGLRPLGGGGPHAIVPRDPRAHLATGCTGGWDVVARGQHHTAERRVLPPRRTDLERRAGERRLELISLEQERRDQAERRHATDRRHPAGRRQVEVDRSHGVRSEEHTSELQSQSNLVCRLLLEKKNKP